ncbi:uncharacterized protein TNCV_2814821 [Trichonephila clavipes]|nr:uncharacterized protein TNCV_2814821 [Trichonephila clavipes]
MYLIFDANMWDFLIANARALKIYKAIMVKTCFLRQTGRNQEAAIRQTQIICITYNSFFLQKNKGSQKAMSNECQTKKRKRKRRYFSPKCPNNPSFSVGEPTRRQPNHQTFARVHQNLVERGSFRATIKGTGRRRIARTPIFEEDVLHAVDQTPGTSVRALAASTGRSPTTIHRVLQGATLHPFHVQRVQSLQPDDPSRRVTFAQWFLNQIAADMHFASFVLFCGEATFSREGVFNTHNAHMWALNNPHSTRPRAMQQRFTVNVWAGIVGDSLLGPYILPPRLDSHKYLVFLQEVLPELLTDVPAPIRRRMWFQQDRAPSHYARHVREHLDRTFPNRWIGRGGPVAWPPRSPDLSPLGGY